MELSRRPLDDVEAWMDTYRRLAGGRLDRLGQVLERHDPEEESDG